MKSTEGIAPPPQLGLAATDGFIVTMRECLAKPRVAREFQDLKTDAQKLRSTERDRRSLNERAAEAELDAGRRARAYDQHRHNRLGFVFGALLGTLFVGLDAVPANLDAQTFGLGPLPRWRITEVSLSELVAGML